MLPSRRQVLLLYNAHSRHRGQSSRTWGLWLGPNPLHLLCRYAPTKCRVSTQIRMGIPEPAGAALCLGFLPWLSWVGARSSGKQEKDRAQQCPKSPMANRCCMCVCPVPPFLNCMVQARLDLLATTPAEWIVTPPIKEILTLSVFSMQSVRVGIEPTINLCLQGIAHPGMGGPRAATLCIFLSSPWTVFVVGRGVTLTVNDVLTCYGLSNRWID